MGVRVYIPAIGRFLQVDPVEGGTENNYVYPTDPVNGSDLTGTIDVKKRIKDIWNSYKKAKSAYYNANKKIVDYIKFYSKSENQQALFLMLLGGGKGKGISSLNGRMAIAEARANPFAGKMIVPKNAIKDARYSGIWEKWAYNHKGLNGKNFEVHYMRNTKTGKFADFKLITNGGW
jgi:hypothetical protein